RMMAAGEMRRQLLAADTLAEQALAAAYLSLTEIDQAHLWGLLVEGVYPSCLWKAVAGSPMTSLPQTCYCGQSATYQQSTWLRAPDAVRRAAGNADQLSGANLSQEWHSIAVKAVD